MAEALILYCTNCQGHTPHAHIVDTFATRCTVCGNIRSQLERADTESHNYTAPDGEPGVLVENTADRAVFYIERGQYAGYYYYDKRTGFGAIQEAPPPSI